MLRRSFLTTCAGAAATASLARSTDSGKMLAPTPPMGWMSWNQFGPEVSDSLVRETAETMLATGMRKAGYEYICIDDLWHGGRGTDGRLYPDSRRFPNGIRLLADWLHAKGFRLGMYSDVAEKTCAEQPASYGYEEVDAQTFADWGVDYLKVDYCFAPEDPETAIVRYRKMIQAVRKTGRPMVFSVCEWGPREPWTWAPEIGAQLWRTTWDIRDIWQGEYNDDHLGIMDIVDRQAGLAEFAGPGHWNDPDMLVVGLHGKGRYTSPKGWPPPNDVEYRSQMSLWCLMASPLLATCDLRKMNAATTEILTNPEILAINQDVLGKQARRAIKDRDFEVWKKPLSGGRVALGLLNRGPQAGEMKLKFTDIALAESWKVRDVWAKKDLGAVRDTLSLPVASHETRVVVLTR
jgi:alpha-galactosidase